MTNSQPLHTMHCERCGSELTSEDCSAQEHQWEILPHDGYQCQRCNRLYFIQAETFTVLVYRSGRYAQTFEVIAKAHDLADAHAAAKCFVAHELNCWVGELSVLADTALAA